LEILPWRGQYDAYGRIFCHRIASEVPDGPIGVQGSCEFGRATNHDEHMNLTGIEEEFDLRLMFSIFS